MKIYRKNKEKDRINFDKESVEIAVDLETKEKGYRHKLQKRQT